ncbi:MAG: XRE family transcriptional regulator [Flavobacteriaceae bacterium]|nr:XRE family transcriptional regulator [Flavobacteriaceae bacterium]
MFQIDTDPNLTEIKELFAKRIKKARLLYGMSQDDLIKSLDNKISKEELVEYEQGLVIPDSSKIIEIANHLRLKFAYFFNPITIRNTDVRFRENISLHPDESNSLKERVTESLERYTEIEYHLKENNSEKCLSDATYSLSSVTDNWLPVTGFSNPIKNETIGSVTDVNKIVNALLNAWGLGYNGLPNAIKIIEDKGIKVLEFHQPQSINALSGWANKTTPFIIIKPKVEIQIRNDNKLPPLNDHSSNEYTFDDLEELIGIPQGYEEKRFLVLRELGYLLLNFSSKLTDKKKEDLCSEFAAAVLMPYKTFIKEVGNKRKNGIRIGELRNIKKIYGIPIHVVIDRARRLNIITEYDYLRFQKGVSYRLSDLIKAKKSYDGHHALDEKHHSLEGKAPSIAIDAHEEEPLKRSIYHSRYKDGKVEHPMRFMQLVYKAVESEIISMSKGAELCNEKTGYFREHYMDI